MNSSSKLWKYISSEQYLYIYDSGREYVLGISKLSVLEAISPR